MRKVLLVVAMGATSIAGFIGWWRRHPRFGAGTVNRVVNPRLIEQGVPELSSGEIGLLEHVGRKTGAIRITPVHPVATADGYRIIVPLGTESQWARNVLAAGHCRVQIGDAVHQLDEPRLLEPTEIEAVPAAAGRLMAWLGFRYLRLHEFAKRPGTLETSAIEAAPTAPSSSEPVLIEPVPIEPEVVPVA